MPSFYDTTIAPSTTRFFSDVQADPRLTSRTKAQLQGTMLAGLQEVEAQRAKMQEERDQSAMRQLQYETGSLNLEQAKMDRKRLEDSAAKGAAMDADLSAVLDSDTDYETKSANLAKVQMKYSDLTTNPAIRYKLDAAKDAIIRPLATRPLMTPAQEFQMGQEGVDPEDLGGSPFAALGRKSRLAKNAEEQKKLDLEAEKQRDKEMYDLLNAKIDFEKSEDLPDGAQTPKWLKPESHQAAKLLMQYANPDEKKKFEAAGPANDDVTRANIARDVQVRMLQKRFSGTVKDPLKPTSDEKGAWLVNAPPPMLKRPE